MREAYPVSTVQLFRGIPSASRCRRTPVDPDGVVEKQLFHRAGFARGFCIGTMRHLVCDRRHVAVVDERLPVSFVRQRTSNCSKRRPAENSNDARRLFEKEVELANWSRRMSDRIILRMERRSSSVISTAAERYRHAGRTRAGNCARCGRLLPRHFCRFPESDPRRRTIDSPKVRFKTVNRNENFTDFCGL